MRIALVQQHCTEDRNKNRERGVDAVKKAVNNGAQVICFAELGFEPFYPQERVVPLKLELAETIPGPTTDQFSELASKHGIVIILNLFECEGERTYDSSPVINIDGHILGKTRMVHIPDYPCFHEQGYYHPGDCGAPVYETPFGKISVAICYDRHFPEYMRALALGGTKVVFVPQAGAVDEWPAGLYECEMRVAAFQNGYYIALCNRVGKESKLTFAGESFICDPSGSIIAQAPRGVDDILYCDLDLDEIEESYAQKYFLLDRRSELYGDWLNH